MQATETQALTGSPDPEFTSNKENSSSIKSKNGISDSTIRSALQSIADLRRYLLVEHPSLLATAAPNLVIAESSIFNIWDNIQTGQTA